ncbi:hypothetical protein ES703_44545 [subsurface metagenome]
MRECHETELSSAGKEAKAKAQGKSRLAAAGGMTAAEFDEKRRRDKKALFTVPAKPYTPEEMAKFAEERRLPDKKEQEEFLTREWEIARSNHHIY